jgi:hypothetical protein
LFAVDTHPFPGFSPKPSRRLLLAGILPILLAGLFACSPGSREAPPPEPLDHTPRLVLHIVVDQFRADYVERFEPVWSGGVRRLLDEGVVFTDMQHAHDSTVTATGHATLSTGMEPRHHGIVANSWYQDDSRRKMTSVGDPVHGVSPRQLLTPTFGDHLKRRWPEARVFAVGGKDRASILSAGLDADAAFFFDDAAGIFTTSSYYLEAPPPWLTEFNRRALLDRHFGFAWEPLVAPAQLPSGLGLEPDPAGNDRPFHHPLGGLSLAPDSRWYRAVADTPLIDAHVFELARALIKAEDLGRDRWPDFLAVTLPATDFVGHDYGPDRHELVDTVMRVDRELGAFLEWLDATIGLEHVLVSFTSDHGVDRSPEVMQRHGIEARRLDWELITCVQRAGLEVGEHFGGLRFDRGLRLDADDLASKGLDPDQVKAALIEALEMCPGVARVHDGAALATRSDLDQIEQLYAAGYCPGRSPDLLLQPVEHLTMTRNAVATHGTPYDYDTRVPWIVCWQNRAPGRVDAPVRSVDVAPTLASYVGLDLEETVDGANRRALIEAAAAQVAAE